MRKKRHLRKELEELLWTGFIGGLLLFSILNVFVIGG